MRTVCQLEKHDHYDGPLLHMEYTKSTSTLSNGAFSSAENFVSLKPRQDAGFLAIWSHPMRAGAPKKNAIVLDPFTMLFLFFNPDMGEMVTNLANAAAERHNANFASGKLQENSIHGDVSHVVGKRVVNCVERPEFLSAYEVRLTATSFSYLARNNHPNVELSKDNMQIQIRVYQYVYKKDGKKSGANIIKSDSELQTTILMPSTNGFYQEYSTFMGTLANTEVRKFMAATVLKLKEDPANRSFLLTVLSEEEYACDSAEALLALRFGEK